MINLGDFNSGIDDANRTLYETYELKSLIKEPTSHKNPDNPSYIDFKITSNP